jgi:hypothetical protein
MEMMLTLEHTARFDDRHWPALRGYRWYPVRDGRTWYAYANTAGPDGRATTVKMHRLIMAAEPGQIVDHVNGDGLDNRDENLRFVTHSQNHANAPKISAETSSRYKGVYWHKPSGRWLVQIRIDGHKTHVGYFSDEVEAARAYDAAARQYHGEYAKLNLS